MSSAIPFPGEVDIEDVPEDKDGPVEPSSGLVSSQHTRHDDVGDVLGG